MDLVYLANHIYLSIYLSNYLESVNNLINLVSLVNFADHIIYLSTYLSIYLSSYLQDSLSRFHTIPKPALGMRVW